MSIFYKLFVVSLNFKIIGVKVVSLANAHLFV